MQWNLSRLAHFRWKLGWSLLVQSWNYMILEGPENAYYWPRTKNSQTKKSGAVKSTLPIGRIPRGPDLGVLRRNPVRVSVRAQKVYILIAWIYEGKRDPPRRSPDQGPRPWNPQNSIIEIIIILLRCKPLTFQPDRTSHDHLHVCSFEHDSGFQINQMSTVLSLEILLGNIIIPKSCQLVKFHSDLGWISGYGSQTP